MFGGAIAVVNVRGSADSVRAAIVRGQPALGWTLAKTQSSTGLGWGFQPNPADVHVLRKPRTASFCSSGGASLVAQIAEQPGGVSRVTFGETQLPNGCGGSDQLQLPLLVSPPTAGDTFERCAANWGSIRSSMQLYAPDAMPDSIYAHYARQLADSGWATSAKSKMAGAVWTRTDAAGHRQQIVLSVAPGRVPGCYDAKMDGIRVEPSR